MKNNWQDLALQLIKVANNPNEKSVIRRENRAQ
jgi:hypothetical protein